MSRVSFIAFAGDRCIASGDLGAVARAAKATLDRHKDASIFAARLRTFWRDCRKCQKRAQWKP